VDVSFRRWVAAHTDDRTTDMLAAACGVFTFVHDPGSLSAAFVWERARRVLLRFPPAARFPSAAGPHWMGHVRAAGEVLD
jgi:hypothetical protein